MPGILAPVDQECVEVGGMSIYTSDDLATWQSHGLAPEPDEGHPAIGKRASGSPFAARRMPQITYAKKSSDAFLQKAVGFEVIGIVSRRKAALFDMLLLSMFDSAAAYISERLPVPPV
ncbi:hypothetical protein CTA2_9237 [Colletotrichum tanaceti]|nr:hypothetical protein CTA2_9237 [Colletotrichum tanaceti]